MWKRSFHLLVSVVVLLLLTACSGSGEDEARLGEKVSLAIGQTVVLAGEGSVNYFRSSEGR